MASVSYSGLLTSMFAWLRGGAPRLADWRSVVSDRPSLELAVADLADQLKGFGAVDLGIVFVSASFASELPRLLPLLHQSFPTSHWIGGCGGGVIGDDRHGRSCEFEEKPAIGVTLLRLPAATLKTFRVDMDALPDLDGPREPWEDLVGIPQAELGGLLLLSDPRSSGIKDLLNGLDYAFPDAPKVGGIAASHSANCGSLLFEDTTCTGAIGVAIGGRWCLQAVVAQGCRPIGPVFEVQEAKRNVMFKLQPDDQDRIGATAKAPVTCLQEVMGELSASDRELVRHSLFIGLSSSSFNLTSGTTSEPTDSFLIRTMMGIDPRNGAIAIGDRIRVGQRVQFHLRDGETSRNELQMLLECQRKDGETPLGAFCFACIGRGTNLYGEPDVDSGLCRVAYPQLPIGGMFCNGEIGPVQGSTHLHGFTASWGFLCAKPSTSSAQPQPDPVPSPVV